MLTSLGEASIAVFEQEPSDGQRLVEYLQKKGFKVQYLTEVPATISLVRQGLIPVVVISITESLVELQLCSALKEGDEPPAVIGLSDRDLTRELDAKLGPEARPDQLFVRPVSFHQLLHGIEQQLAERERHKEQAPLLFLETLVELWRRRQTGMLRITTEGLQTTIYVREGVPVFAEQGSLGDTLGRMLVKMGKITAEQLSRAIDLITESLVDNEQLRLGEALVQLGFLTADEVMEALREQMQAKILACFRLERFHSDFKPGAEHLAEVGSFQVPFGRLMTRGIKSEVSAERLDRYLAPHQGCYVSLAREVKDLTRGLGLTPQEQVFLRSIDGKKPLRLLLQSSALERIQCGQLLAVLALTASIRLDASLPRTTARRSGAEPPAAAEDKAPEERAPAKPALSVSEPASPPKTGQRLRDKVMGMYLRIKGRSDWDELQVERGASQQEIEAAFETRTQELRAIHAAEASDEETLQKLDEMAKELQQARDRLLAGNARGAAGDWRERQGRLLAEKAFQQGMLQLEAGQHRQAVDSFASASKLCPEANEYRMYQLWASYRSASSARARAASRRDLRNLAVWMTKHHQDLAKGHLIVGQLLLEEQKYDEAERYLQEAASLDHDDVEITRAIKKLEAERPAAQPRPREKKKKFKLF